MLVKTPSSKKAFRERSHSQWGQSPPSRADSACFSPNQTTHKLCVSLLVLCSVGREEHTICNVICFCPYVPLSWYRLDLSRYTGTFYVARIVTWQITVNKTQIIDCDWHTQRALLNDKKQTPVAPHVLLSLLVMTSPAHDVLAIVWTDYTVQSNSEHGIAEGVPLALSTQLQFLEGNCFFFCFAIMFYIMFL